MCLLILKNQTHFYRYLSSLILIYAYNNPAGAKLFKLQILNLDLISRKKIIKYHKLISKNLVNFL